MPSRAMSFGLSGALASMSTVANALTLTVASRPSTSKLGSVSAMPPQPMLRAVLRFLHRSLEAELFVPCSISVRIKFVVELRMPRKRISRAAGSASRNSDAQSAGSARRPHLHLQRRCKWDGGFKQEAHPVGRCQVAQLVIGVNDRALGACYSKYTTVSALCSFPQRKPLQTGGSTCLPFQVL